MIAFLLTILGSFKDPSQIATTIEWINPYNSFPILRKSFFTAIGTRPLDVVLWHLGEQLLFPGLVILSISYIYRRLMLFFSSLTIESYYHKKGSIWSTMIISILRLVMIIPRVHLVRITMDWLLLWYNNQTKTDPVCQCFVLNSMTACQMANPPSESGDRWLIEQMRTVTPPTVNMIIALLRYMWTFDWPRAATTASCAFGYNVWDRMFSPHLPLFQQTEFYQLALVFGIVIIDSLWTITVDIPPVNAMIMRVRRLLPLLPAPNDIPALPAPPYTTHKILSHPPSDNGPIPPSGTVMIEYNTRVFVQEDEASKWIDADNIPISKPSIHHNFSQRKR